MKGVAAALGANERSALQLTTCIGTGMGYLAMLPRETRDGLIDNIIVELSTLQYIASDGTSDERKGFKDGTVEDARRAISHIVETTAAPARSDGTFARGENPIIASYARKMPAQIVKKITAMFKELPDIGVLVEVAPSKSVSVTDTVVEESRAHVKESHFVYGVPSVDAWKPANVQTVIINALDMRALSYLAIHFAYAIARSNGAAFIIIVHNVGVIVNSEQAISTLRITSDACISILSSSEKKIVSVSNIMRVD
jgi:hypothetical protein